MARKIPLLRVNGNARFAEFDYGLMMKQILEFGPPGGMQLDLVIRCVKALEPLEAAIERGDEAVTFPEEAYRTLRERLDVYAFPVAHKVIAEFGLTIREAEEIT